MFNAQTINPPLALAIDTQCPPIILNESTSVIEKQPQSPSSLKSINSYVKLFSNNNQPIINDNQQQQQQKPQNLKPTTSRNIIISSTGVLLNPYISPTIKVKINDIIADATHPQSSSYGRYKFCFNKMQTQPNSLIKTTALKASKHCINSFSNYSNRKDSSSAYKTNQFKQKFQKTIEELSSSNANANHNHNQPLYVHTSRTNITQKPLLSLKHSLPGNILSLKKTLFNNQNEEEIDSFQKEFKAIRKGYHNTYKSKGNGNRHSNNFFMKRIIN